MRSRGRWRTVASTSRECVPPTDLLSEALDSGQPVARGDWNVSPLSPQHDSGELLVAYRPRKSANERELLFFYKIAGYATFSRLQFAALPEPPAGPTRED